MLTDKELVELVNRLDPITLHFHQVDVAHIALIGQPEDIIALDAYLEQKERGKPRDQATRTPNELRQIDRFGKVWLGRS